HLILALHSPPPPSPNLFPYTTLFRSRRRDHHDRVDLGTRVRRTHDLQRGEGRRNQSRKISRAAARADEHPRQQHRSWLDTLSRRDRKSTRLNSSHEWISYAVFCLKKK